MSDQTAPGTEFRAHDHLPDGAVAIRREVFMAGRDHESKLVWGRLAAGASQR